MGMECLQNMKVQFILDEKKHLETFWFANEGRNKHNLLIKNLKTGLAPRFCQMQEKLSVFVFL